MKQIIDFYCSLCKRYLGSVDGEENVEEAKKMYSIYEDDVCWKCKQEIETMKTFMQAHKSAREENNNEFN